MQIKIGLLLCLLLGRSTSLLSQSYVGVAVAGHMPMTLDQLDYTHPKASYGGELGFVYEWHANQFVLQTGLQYAMDCPVVNLDDQNIEQAMIDTRNVAFIYRGMLRNRLDKIVIGQLAVPFYLGGEWNGFYAMVGVKAVLNLHAQSYQQAELKTAGDYQNRYYEWLENMPNHGYHDYQAVLTAKPVSLRLYDVRIGAELGYTLHLPGYNASVSNIRIGAFVEYGIIPMVDKQNNLSSSVQPDFAHYMSVDMTHVYTSLEGVKAEPHMLVCGAKITALFSVSSSRHSSTRKYPCRCYLY